MAPDARAESATQPEPGAGPGRRPAWLEVLSREEIRDLVRHRDLRSVGSLLVDWGLVGASFALVARWPGPLSILLALFVIGTRQLGLAILMHDAAHHALFRDRRVNDLVGNWLCAYPVWADVHPYRAYHLQHHAKNWTAADPDLGLVTPFPITRASLRRKILRDLTGRTGWKRARATLRRDLGLSKGRQPRVLGGVRNLHGVVATNLALLSVLALAGHPALYLLWVVAWFTTFQLVTRIRAIAEHAMAPDPSDPMRNTRTTLADPLARLLVAPNRVNYHLEHHLLMTVPHYNLPRLHAMLRDRGALDGAWVAKGYLGVLREAASRPA
ncbi:MAG: fatty acid desaturase family protein [Alphaproteobacteria bacterium]